MNLNRNYSVKEYAQLKGATTVTVKQWIEHKKIQAIQFDNKWLREPNTETIILSLEDRQQNTTKISNR